MFENVNHLSDKHFGMYKPKDIRFQKCVVVNDESDNKMIIIGLKAGEREEVIEKGEEKVKDEIQSCKKRC